MPIVGPVPEQSWPDLRWAVRDLYARSGDYALYRRYYDGEHRHLFRTQQFEDEFRRIFDEYRDNLIPRCVDGKVDRLQLLGFGGDADDEVIRALAQDIWDRNILERRQGEIHQEALKMGDGFVLVWPDDSGFPIWYPHRAERVAVKYDEADPSEIQRAAKCWVVEDPEADPHSERQTFYWRVNIYYEDRIEKYRTATPFRDDAPGDMTDKEKGWEAYQDDEDTGWPLPHALGQVPWFHWANNSGMGAYGKSEVKDAIPIQDALNVANIQTLVAAEFHSLPQRWAVGIQEPQRDALGKPMPGQGFEPGADRIWATGNPNARFGEFGTADLAKLIEHCNDKRMEMARVTSTPMHWLLLGSGQFPAGVALRAAEGPLIALLDDRVKAFSLPWEKAMAFSIRIMSGAELEQRLPASWGSTTPDIDPAEKAAELTAKKDHGVPDEQIWREWGYDEDQIEQFAAAKADRVQNMQAAMNAGVPEPTLMPQDRAAMGLPVQ